jgi:hypothetical protein
MELWRFNGAVEVQIGAMVVQNGAMEVLNGAIKVQNGAMEDRGRSQRGAVEDL